MHFSPLRADVIQIHSQLSPPPPPHYTFRPSTRKERRPTPKYRILRPSRPLHHLMHFETFISRSASAYYYHNSGRLSCKNAIDLATAFVKCTPRLRFLLVTTCSEYHRANIEIEMSRGGVLGAPRVASTASQTGDNLRISRRWREGRLRRQTLRREGRPAVPSQKIYAILNFRRVARRRQIRRVSALYSCR
jgi:hypothetical protein